jgi:hypothetical protein
MMSVLSYTNIWNDYLNDSGARANFVENGIKYYMCLVCRYTRIRYSKRVWVVAKKNDEKSIEYAKQHKLKFIAIGVMLVQRN